MLEFDLNRSVWTVQSLLDLERLLQRMRLTFYLKDVVVLDFSILMILDDENFRFLFSIFAVGGGIAKSSQLASS